MSVPAERLTAIDIHRYLDWLVEAFDAGDQLLEVEERDRATGRLRLRVVFQIDRQLDRLERVLAHISEPHYSQAEKLVAELKRARWSEEARAALPQTFVRLRMVIADWDRNRPRLACGCGLAFRSERQLAEHLALIHEQEVA